MTSSALPREGKQRVVSQYYYFAHLHSNLPPATTRNASATSAYGMGRMDVDFEVAWNTINLISKEYNYMWDKLEKLEILLYQQQNVIAQLLSALITSDEVDYSSGDIDFIYEDLSEMVLKYHNEKDFPNGQNELIHTPIKEHFNALSIEAVDRKVESVIPAYNETEKEEFIHEPFPEKHAPEKRTSEAAIVREERRKSPTTISEPSKPKRKEVNVEVFTAQDYVHYHEDTQSLVSDNDIENLIQMDRLFNRSDLFRDSVRTEHVVCHEVQDSETQTEICNWLRENEHQVRRFSNHDAFQSVEELCHPLKTAHSGGGDTSPRDQMLSMETTYGPSSSSRRTSEVVEPMAKPELDADYRYLEHRPSLVKEDPIDEQFDIQLLLEEPVHVYSTQTNAGERKGSFGLLSKKETHIHPEEPVSNLLAPESRPKCASANLYELNRVESICEPTANGIIGEKRGVCQHRRVNSLEEKNILSSITNSVKLSYQNVFSRSSLFKRDSKEQMHPMHSTHVAVVGGASVQPAQQPVLVQPPQGNIKDSLKNIWGGFKSLQEPVSPGPRKENNRTPEQPAKQMSLPEPLPQANIPVEENLGLDTSEPILLNESVEMEMELPEEELTLVATPNREPLVKANNNSDTHHERKKSFRMHSMQEANTMMDTLKVNSCKEDSQRNKLEKSFSDESAIFSFTPSSRQSSIMQSEQESEQMSSDSVYYAKENDDRTRARSASNHLPIILDKAEESELARNEGIPHTG